MITPWFITEIDINWWRLLRQLASTNCLEAVQVCQNHSNGHHQMLTDSKWLLGLHCREKCIYGS